MRKGGERRRGKEEEGKDGVDDVCALVLCAIRHIRYRQSAADEEEKAGTVCMCVCACVNVQGQARRERMCEEERNESKLYRGNTTTTLQGEQEKQQPSR